jgi:predicted nucleic acid-binding Zn ribbon protein
VTGRDSEPRPLGEALDRLVRSMGAPSASALEKVFGNWADVVGAEVAEHSKPVKLDGNRLTVEVADPAWASQLRWMTTEVLAALAREVGDGAVTALTVRVSNSSK